MYYILSLVIMLILYVTCICCMKYMKNTKLWNFIMSAIVFILYISHMVTIYLNTGVNDWNFRNTLPVANVSPFMFTLLPFIYLLPQKVKKYFKLLVSLLSVGMLFSAIFNCIYNCSIEYAFHFHFLLDYMAHIMLSLLGIYFVKSKQVELNKKDAIISASIILIVAFIMLILNLIFDRSFFGLSLNGKHNIYNIIVSDNSYVSALVYFVGATFVLFLGYIYNKLLNRKKNLP